MKKAARAIFLGCAGGAAVLGAGLWTYGQKKPINKYIPFAVTLNRPALRPYRDDLLRGNEWGYLCSPKTAENGLPSDAGDCAMGLQTLEDHILAGEQVFYNVFSGRALDKNPDLKNVGFYCLRGNSDGKKPYVIMLAGGGFNAVCTLWESLPVCAAFNRMGYTCFCMRYRTVPRGTGWPPEQQLMDDVAACIGYITDHAEEFGVEPENYLIGGFSAGSIITNMWANEKAGYGKYGLPKPGAVCLIYGVEEEYGKEGYHVPTFVRYCLKDRYYDSNAPFLELEARLREKGIPNDVRGVDAGHGFGLGTNSGAEGWTEEAEAFWRGCLREM